MGIKVVVMLPKAKSDALKRLNYIAGHVRGVQRMIEDESYCVDVIKQTYAIRAGLEKVEKLLLDGHLNSCVIDGVRNGKEKEVFKELVDLYDITSS